MQKFISSLLSIAVVFFAACQSGSEQSAQTEQKAAMSDMPLKITLKENKEGFAVVELFTSEGCSSCPPADRLTEELAKEAEAKGQDVYILAFHVDYWNRLGWRDRFSKQAFSNRQYWYAEQFKQGTVYTPQMIVNGATEFVGSRRAEAKEAIREALTQTEENQIQIDLTNTEKAGEIAYTIDEVPENTQLHYAWVEKDLSSKVKSGENRGRNLHHYSVVWDLKTIDQPQTSGKLALDFAHQDGGKYELIAFLQHEKGAKILGASRYEFEIN